MGGRKTRSAASKLPSSPGPHDSSFIELDNGSDVDFFAYQSSPEPDDSSDESFQVVPKTSARARQRKIGTRSSPQEEHPEDHIAAKRNSDAEEETIANGHEAKRPKTLLTEEDHDDFRYLHVKLGQVFEIKSRALNKAEAEVCELSGRLECIEGNLATAKNKLADAERKLSISQEMLTAAKNELQKKGARQEQKEHHCAEVQSLKAQLRASEEQFANLDARFTTVVNELFDATEKIQGGGRYQKVLHGEISNLWGSMEFNIRTLTSQFNEEQGIKTPPKSYPKDRVLTELITKCRSEPSGARYFIEQWIWKQIHTTVFSAKGGIWGGEFGQVLSSFILDMQNRGLNEPQYMELVSRIKARICEDVDEKLQVNPAALKKLVDGLCSKLKIFPISQPQRSTRPSLEEICDQALKLHIIMMKSKAIFKVDWEAIETPKEENERMIVVYNTQYLLNPSSTTELICPVLVKIGMADGFDFHKRCVIGQTRAMCRRPMKIDDGETSSSEAEPEDGGLLDKKKIDKETSTNAAEIEAFSSEELKAAPREDVSSDSATL